MSATPQDGTAGAAADAPQDRVPQGAASGTRRRAFLAILGRDLWVTVRREPGGFLAQALLQPIFFLFVFGRVLPEIGQAQGVPVLRHGPRVGAHPPH